MSNTDTATRRKRVKQRDLAGLKRLNDGLVHVDTRWMMAATMKMCGLSYQDIGDVFHITRQAAAQLVRNRSKGIVPATLSELSEAIDFDAEVEAKAEEVRLDILKQAEKQRLENIANRELPHFAYTPRRPQQ